MNDFQKFTGRVFSKEIEGEIILLSKERPYFEINCSGMITDDYRPNRIRIFVNNLEEQVIQMMYRGELLLKIIIYITTSFI